MKKDGTQYLCEVEFENGDMDFVVLYWGTPAGFSDNYGEPGWYTPGGSRVKLKKIFCLGTFTVSAIRFFQYKQM